MSLVEIMLASFILAVVMIPVLSLIFGGIRETARGRDQATAVSLAANIMTQLIDKVPYDQFVLQEGPTPLDPAEFFKADLESPGLFGGLKQCRLGKDEASRAIWEKILDRTPEDENRTIFKDGTTFEVILFAGQYKNEDTGGGTGSFNVPSLTKELTFSYFRNPWIEMSGARQSAVRKLVVLDADYPYESTGVAPPSGVTRIDDPRVKPGWPDPGGDGMVTESNFYKGSGSTVPTGGEDPNEHTELTWPRFTFDLHDFREDNGAMLKLVLGLRWKPGAGNSKGSDYTRTSKEFWLVSFKAKLEER